VSTVAVHVLTIGKLGGTAVAPKAVLRAGLARGSAVVFAPPGVKLTCKRSTFSKTVSSNPDAPSMPSYRPPGRPFSKCTVSIPTVTVKSVTAVNLPYTVSASDAKGDPVKLVQMIR